MGMIPINVDNIEDFNPDMYKFTLEKSNKTQNVIDVTTNDIVVLILKQMKKKILKNSFLKILLLETIY